MIERIRVTDDEINAYVDGALAPGDRDAVGAIIARNPDLAATVAAFRAQRDGLLRLYGGIAQEPVPRALRDMVETARRRVAVTSRRNVGVLLEA